MKKYLRLTTIKLIIGCLATILPILIITILPPYLEENIADIVSPLRYILFILLEGVIIWKIIKYVRILKNEEYANNVYIKAKDERIIFLKMKAVILTFKITLYSVTIATLICGFLNEMLFYGLGSVLVLSSVTLFITGIYYNKKY